MAYKKKHMTLLEIMIVIVLIGVISSIVGINIKGSMEKAKNTENKLAAEKLKNALMYKVAEDKLDLGDPTIKKGIETEPANYLKDNPLVAEKDVENLLKNPWGKPFIIQVENGDITIR